MTFIRKAKEESRKRGRSCCVASSTTTAMATRRERWRLSLPPSLPLPSPHFLRAELLLPGSIVVVIVVFTAVVVIVVVIFIIVIVVFTAVVVIVVIVVVIVCFLCCCFQKEKARAIDNCLSSLHRQLFLESNPSPVKFCVATLGLIESKRGRLEEWKRSSSQRQRGEVVVAAAMPIIVAVGLTVIVVHTWLSIASAWLCAFAASPCAAEPGRVCVCVCVQRVCVYSFACACGSLCVCVDVYG